MTNCQQIKETFADIKPDAADLPELFERYKQTADQQKKKVIRQKLERLDEFRGQLKEQIENLLTEHPEAEEFAGKVAIDNGRVIVDGDINLWSTVSDTDITYFPQIIRAITGDAVFQGSSVKNLSNLELIGGRANFRSSDVQDLSSLKKIKGRAVFEGGPTKKLSSLEYIGSLECFPGTDFEGLDNLKKIDGDVIFHIGEEFDLSDVEVSGDIVYR